MRPRCEVEKVRAVTSDDQDDKREQAIEAVKEAWRALAKAAPDDPGELVDVTHVRVLDGEGERVDAAVAVVRKGKVSRAATQGLGDSFESACDMLAQILLLRASLLRAARAEGLPPDSHDPL
ncbi:MAG: hypothetical protein MUF54_04660 [Polyangiaceae bacterium]|nr:hypothetical protein [Polyangiaceae bacterium]